MKSRFGIGLSFLGLLMVTAFQNCAGGLPDNLDKAKAVPASPAPAGPNDVTFTPASVDPNSTDPLNICAGTWQISVNNVSGTFTILQRAADGEFTGEITIAPPLSPAGQPETDVIQGACTSTGSNSGHIAFMQVLQGSSVSYEGDWISFSNTVAIINAGTWSQQNFGQGSWTAQSLGK